MSLHWDRASASIAEAQEDIKELVSKWKEMLISQPACVEFHFFDGTSYTIPNFALMQKQMSVYSKDNIPGTLVLRDGGRGVIKAGELLLSDPEEYGDNSCIMKLDPCWINIRHRNLDPNNGGATDNTWDGTSSTYMAVHNWDGVNVMSRSISDQELNDPNGWWNMSSSTLKVASSINKTYGFYTSSEKDFPTGSSDTDRYSNSGVLLNRNHLISMDSGATVFELTPNSLSFRDFTVCPFKIESNGGSTTVTTVMNGITAAVPLCASYTSSGTQPITTTTITTGLSTTTSISGNTVTVTVTVPSGVSGPIAGLLLLV